jgi:hypothetical protein
VGSGALIGRGACASPSEPHGLFGDLVDAPGRQLLRRFGLICPAASIGRELCAFNPAEAEPPREARPPKTAPRLRDGSLMLFTPALISAPVHASRLVRKFEARPIAAQLRLIFCAII